MTTDDTLGDRLNALRKRSGLTLDAFAKVGAWGGRSAVQKFFAPDYDPDWPSTKLVSGALSAFVGHGDPPIAEAEVRAAFGIGGLQAGAAQKLASSPHSVVQEVLAMLRDESISERVRLAAAAEMLSRMVR